MKLIDGKKLADDIKASVYKEVKNLGYTPGLAVFLIGDDPASELYVKLKEKASKQVAVDFHRYKTEATISQDELIQSIEFINADPTIDAMLIQFPLPAGFDEAKVIAAMDPKKDVDGFHPQILQNFLDGKDSFMPGLSEGIYKLIEASGEFLPGKKACIIANSDIFAKPLTKILEDKQISVEVKHADEANLADCSRQADIVIIAIGKAKFLKADMIKEGAILIDVGTNKVEGKVVGDVDFDNVKEKAGFITPVPGGVGPVTVAMLLENTVKLAKRNRA